MSKRHNFLLQKCQSYAFIPLRKALSFPIIMWRSREIWFITQSICWCLLKMMTSKCPWLSWITCLIFHSHRTSNLAPATSFSNRRSGYLNFSLGSPTSVFYRQSRSCSLRAQTSRECRSKSCVSVGRSPHNTARCHRLWRSGWPSAPRPDMKAW